MRWACNKNNWLHTYLTVQSNARQELSAPTAWQRLDYFVTA